jgi:hypothetical protein
MSEGNVRRNIFDGERYLTPYPEYTPHIPPILRGISHISPWGMGGTGGVVSHPQVPGPSCFAGRSAVLHGCSPCPQRAVGAAGVRPVGWRQRAVGGPVLQRRRVARAGTL